MKRISALLLVLVMLLSTLVACTTTPDASDPLTAAKDYVYAMYKDDDGKVTAADYKVVGMVTIEGVKYTVEWSTDKADDVKIVPAEDGKLVTIDINEQTPAEVQYVLTATIKSADGKSATCSFKHTIPAYKEASWEDYKNAETDAPVVVKGVVTGIIAKSKGNSYNCLYIQDNVGGYYVYSLKDDPAEAGVKVGMTVKVSGTKDVYNGTLEIKDGAVEIVSSEIAAIEATDYTAAFTAAASLKDEALVDKQGLLVTIKGVELVSQSADDVKGGYYRFKLGELNTYVRISSSVCPLTKDEQATFKSNFESHIGQSCDVTGVICVYDGAFYLTPVTADAFSNFKAIERSDAEKAQFELDNLTFDAKLTADTVIELLAAGATYTDVALTWVSDNAAAVVADGKLTVTIPENETVIKLTVTAKCGNETKTREFSVTLSKSITSVKDAIALGNTFNKGEYTPDKYLVGGVIVEVQNETYGNVVIKGDSGETFLIYGLYSADGSLRYDKMEKKPAVGDYIVALGVIGKYNDAQMKNGWLVTHVTATAVKDAITVGNTYEKGNYSADKYLLTGVVSEIQNTTYGNFMLKDAEGNQILVYGLYSFDGKVRFDKMEKQPAVGDTVSVYGVLGKNNDAQMKNGWLVALTPAEGGSTEGTTEGTTAGTTGGNENTPATGVTEIKTGVAYYITSKMSAGDLYFKGTVGVGSKGRADGTTNKAEAVAVYLEAGATAGQYYIYFMEGTAKKYLACNGTSSSSFALSDTKDDTCLWTIDATAKTIVSVSTSNRGIATQVASTYYNFSTYSTTNLTSAEYCWAWFVEAK